MHGILADSTFRIECGNSSGSGFSFRQINIIVTNYHVIKPHIVGNFPVAALTEHGQRIPLRILSHSPDNQYDYAIFHAEQPVETNRNFLSPKLQHQNHRGTKIIFAGFPHGIHDLLVHEAIISGPAKPNGFYVDGSVNGGNSGGPIIENDSGEIIGIVTQRRFLGAIQLNTLSQQVTQLVQHCNTVAGRGSAIIMGVNFGAFAGMISQGFLVLDQILQANANSGIGVGFKIDYVNDEYNRLGLT